MAGGPEKDIDPANNSKFIFAYRTASLLNNPVGGYVAYGFGKRHKVSLGFQWNSTPFDQYEIMDGKINDDQYKWVYKDYGYFRTQIITLGYAYRMPLRKPRRNLYLTGELGAGSAFLIWDYNKMDPNTQETLEIDVPVYDSYQSPGGPVIQTGIIYEWKWLNLNASFMGMIPTGNGASFYWNIQSGIGISLYPKKD